MTNPIDPVYTHYDEDGKKIEIGPIDGAKGGRLPSPPKGDRANGKYAGCLGTKDIPGAQCSTKGKGIFATVKRREDQMKSNSLNTKTVIGA